LFQKYVNQLNATEPPTLLCRDEIFLDGLGP
jgi:hypothetical protein